jgi:hypothetical protein
MILFSCFYLEGEGGVWGWGWGWGWGTVRVRLRARDGEREDEGERKTMIVHAWTLTPLQERKSVLVNNNISEISTFFFLDLFSFDYFSFDVDSSSFFFRRFHSKSFTEWWLSLKNTLECVLKREEHSLSFIKCYRLARINIIPFSSFLNQESISCSNSKQYLIQDNRPQNLIFLYKKICIQKLANILFF